MKPNGNKDQKMTNTKDKKLKPGLKSIPHENSVEDEIAAKELAQNLIDSSRFDNELSNQHKVEVFATALAMNWSKWDEYSRIIIVGYLKSLSKRSLPPGIKKNNYISLLRVLTASKILDADPESALRILASIVTDVNKSKEPNEISPDLCIGIQSLFFDDEQNPRYEKLFLSISAPETKIVLQHIAEVAFGQLSDSKDPALVAKQLRFLKILLEKNLLGMLDQLIKISTLKAMKEWPISMLAEVEAIRDEYMAKFPNEYNPFASIIPATKANHIVTLQDSQPNTIPTQQSQPESSSSIAIEPQSISQAIPTVVQRNFEDPHEVVSIVTECFEKLKSDLNTKQQEIKRLNIEKYHNDEIRDKQRARIESLNEENIQLRKKLDTLESELKSESSRLHSVQKENNRLGAELLAGEHKTAELVAKHEQEYEDWSNRLKNISNSNINEFKRGLEIDLCHEFNEIVHLPSDEACIFHKDLIDGIFRKLREKGINVGGGLQ